MFAAGLLVGWSSEAFAYRPFDGTDAAVADLGEAEVRFLLQAQRVSRRQEPSSSTSFVQVRFRISRVPASLPSSVYCCRTAVETAALAQALMLSYRSGGSGGLSI
jgi:hypothetical protein